MLALAFRPGPLYLVHAMFPCAALFIVYLNIEHGTFNWITVVPVVLLSFLFSPLLFATMVGIWWIQNRKLSRDVFVELLDEGLSVENAQARSLLKWDAITEIRETSSFFFFHINKRQAVLVPCNVVSSVRIPELRFQIRKFAQGKIKLLEG